MDHIKNRQCTGRRLFTICLSIKKPQRIESM